MRPPTADERLALEIRREMPNLPLGAEFEIEFLSRKLEACEALVGRLNAENAKLHRRIYDMGIPEP